MLKHYLDLLRQFRFIILAGIVGTGALACVFSLMLRDSMPLFKSSVVLNMQPSEEALNFNRAFMGVTQFNPAVIITQTHIERIMSRQVAERALDILIEESGGSVPAAPPSAFDRVRAFLWETWNMLNYGYFSPPDEREQMINSLREATDVSMVEGSYILMIEITYNSPELAARAANALARAFIETSSLDFAQDATAVDAALERLQAEKTARLSEHIEARRLLQRQLGSESIEDRRVLLTAARIAASQRLTQAEREVERLQTEMERTGSTAASALDGVRAELSASSGAVAPDDIRAELTAAEDLVAQASLSLGSTDAALRSLEATEVALDELALQIRETENDLEQLRSRRLTTELARESRMNQVGIISHAQVPTYPAFPKVLVNTVVGTILGGLLMIAPIAILDVLNSRIRTSEDLRQAVGMRALPTVSRRMAARARRFLQKGSAPGRELTEFAEVMSRRFLTEGHQRWPDHRIYVTAFGSADDVARFHVVVEAAARLMAPRPTAGTPPLSVVLLPEIARLGNWAPYRDATILIGVACGKVETAEIERVSGTPLAPGAVSFFAVVL